MVIRPLQQTIFKIYFAIIGTIFINIFGESLYRIGDKSMVEAFLCYKYEQNYDYIYIKTIDIVSNI